MTHQAPPPNPLGGLYSNLGQLANTVWQSPDLAPIANPSGAPANLLNDLLRYPEYMQQSVEQAMPFGDWGGVTLKRMPLPTGKTLGDFFHLLDNAGNAVARMHVGYHPELKELYVGGLYGISKYLKNKLGPGEIRSLVEELKREYPQAEGVNAMRVSGARGQARAAASARGDPREDLPSTKARIPLKPEAANKEISTWDFLDLMGTTGF